MVQVIISKEAADQIMGLSESCDVCDETGRFVGRVTPSSVLKECRSETEIPFTKDEIEAAFKEPTIPFERIRNRIRQLEALQ